MITEMAKQMIVQQVTGCIKTMVKHLKLVGREIEFTQAAFEIPDEETGIYKVFHKVKNYSVGRVYCWNQEGMPKWVIKNANWRETPELEDF